jgi:hypothetical protein
MPSTVFDTHRKPPCPSMGISVGAIAIVSGVTMRLAVRLLLS